MSRSDHDKGGDIPNPSPKQVTHTGEPMPISARRNPEVIIEDGQGNELGRGTLAGKIEDGNTTPHIHPPRESRKREL